MKRPVKKLIVSSTKAVPPAKKYLEEKAQMAEDIKIKEIELQKKDQQIKHLEDRLNTLENKLVPRTIFISHQLDMSGAPLVFMELFKDYVAKRPSGNTHFHTFLPADEKNIAELHKTAVKVTVHTKPSDTIDFISNDVVYLNTVAHTSELKNSIYKALEENILKKLIWYIHEDDPDLYFGPDEKARIQQLMQEEKLVIYIAAKKMAESYKKFFNNSQQIKSQPYKLAVPKKFHRKRDKKEFDELTFIITGQLRDGRKGQLPILYAFMVFKELYYDKDPARYRDFKLHMVGLANDFISKQVKNHKQKLGGHFIDSPPVPHEKILEYTQAANITICYSISECLPVFVFEGMIAGHPILRNDSSGMEEQLQEGKNGFYLNSRDPEQVVATIEKILNRQETTNRKLSEMSHKSYQMARAYEDITYNKMINEA